MARDLLLDLALENIGKSLGNSGWKEQDEIIIFSFANKEQIRSDKQYRETEKCCYYGKRICLFAEQVKKNNYITLHKRLLEKIIETMDSFESLEEENEGK